MWLIPVFVFIIVQRLVELWIARKNGDYIKSRGGIEYGKEHYKYFVLLHTGFLVSLFLEASLRGCLLCPSIPILSLIALIGFVATQVFRIWCILSLGRFWNTRIIVLPGAKVIQKGPYRIMRHPNYVVVCCELILLSCIFHAYVTGCLFSILNGLLICHRVSVEETALSTHSSYADIMIGRWGFFARKYR